jgi:purine-binding chemotaxis protein CheW
MMPKYHLIDEEFVTFELDRQEYAVPRRRVLDIRGTEAVGNRDNAESCVRGAIPVRDHQAPVLDLRRLFGSDEKTTMEDSLILAVAFGDDSIPMGLLVDSVGTTVPIMAGFSDKETVSKSDPRDKYILGEVQVTGKATLLLNMEKCGQYLRPYGLV